MLQILKKKLHSNRGASMILVLALFLVCTMVSSVILAAASSGISRNAQRAEHQSGYLAISSASDLIIEELTELGVYAGKTITGRRGCQDCTVEGYIDFEGTRVNGYRLDAEYTTNPADKDYASNPLDDGHLLIAKEECSNPYANAVMDEELTTLDGKFGKLFMRACNQVIKTQADYEETIIIGLANEDERLPDVRCVFKMDTDYNVSFQLTSVRFDSSTNTYKVVNDYTIVIKAGATIKTGDIVESTDVSDVHVIYYKEYIEETNTETGEVSGSYTPRKEEWAIPIEVTTVVTEISWGVPSVEKEVLSQ